MIERTPLEHGAGNRLARDERSMRVMEYALAIVALAAALLLAQH